MGAPPTTPSATPPDDQKPQPGVTEQIEHQMIGARDVSFETHRVNPPAALYVTQDDGLYVVVSNVAAGLSINLTATVLLPDGRVQANAWLMTPPSTGVQTPYLFPLAESFLLNVSVMPTASVRYGQTWVFVCVRRGGMVSGINLQTLIAASLDPYGGPTWPGGNLQHSIQGPGLLQFSPYGAVALGTAFIWQVPAWGRVLMHPVFCQFNTSATVPPESFILT